MTREQLAKNIEAYKSFISWIENGKSNIQLSILCRQDKFNPAASS